MMILAQTSNIEKAAGEERADVMTKTIEQPIGDKEGLSAVKNRKSDLLPEICFITLLFLFCFFIFMYEDLISVFDNAVVGVRNLFTGTLGNYYASMATELNNGPNYELPFYLVFIVWSIPLRIFQKLSGLRALDLMPWRIYASLLLVPFILCVVRLMKKIAELCGVSQKRTKWMVFFYLTSLNGFFLPVIVLKQYDMIPVAFILLGFYYFLRDKKLGFVLCFALANTMKTFSLLVFFPLLLLKEKRVSRVILYSLGSVSLLGLCKLMYRNDLAYRASHDAFNQVILERILGGSGFTALQNYKILLFLLMYAGICMLAYCLRLRESGASAYGLYGALFAAASLSGFFISFYSYPYWWDISAPFFFLFLILSKQNLHRNILFSTIASILQFVCFAAYFPHIYGGRALLKYLFLADRLPATDELLYPTLADWITKWGIGAYLDIFASLFFAVWLFLLVSNYPWKGLIPKEDEQMDGDRGLIWGRIAVLMTVCGLILYSGFAKKNTLVYQDSISSEVDQTVWGPDFLSDANLPLTETLQFSEPLELTSIEIRCSELKVKDATPASIILTISNAETKQVVFEGGVPLNTRKSEIIAFDLHDLSVEPGVAYDFRFSTRWRAPGRLLAAMTETQDEHPTYLDHDLISGDLQMRITVKKNP